MTLSRGARGCLKVLESHLGGKDYCWPSQATIAKQMNRTDRQVSRYIRELVACNIITSVRGTSKSPHRYRLQTQISADPAVPVSQPEHPRPLNRGVFESRTAAQEAGTAVADASWDAARDAAWDAAATAAWDAAREAAREAAWDAWDAARDYPWETAWDAARDAAWEAAREATYGGGEPLAAATKAARRSIREFVKRYSKGATQ
jgi:Helix-turn-helix domain